MQPHLTRGELVPVLSEWTPDSKPIYVVYASSRQQSRKLRVFIDWVVELFARQPHLAVGRPINSKA